MQVDAGFGLARSLHRRGGGRVGRRPGLVPWRQACHSGQEAQPVSPLRIGQARQGDGLQRAGHDKLQPGYMSGSGATDSSLACDMDQKTCIHSRVPGGWLEALASPRAWPVRIVASRRYSGPMKPNRPHHRADLVRIATHAMAERGLEPEFPPRVERELATITGPGARTARIFTT